MQTLATAGTFQSSPSSSTTITISSNISSLSFPYTSSPTSIQAGALLSFNTTQSGAVLARFGVSFIDSAQACANAAEEIPDWDWDIVQEASRSKWEDVLKRVTINVEQENPTVVELLYSSVGNAFDMIVSH